MADNRTPLGDPLPLSDADLDRLAVVTAEDVQRAREFWRLHAPERFTDLLEPVLLDITEED